MDLVPEIKAILHQFDLCPLVALRYIQINKGLLCAFMERWQSDTSDFHILMGEMSIALYDVSQILHIIVMGVFFHLPSLTKMDASELLYELLGDSYEESQVVMDMGPSCRLA